MIFEPYITYRNTEGFSCVQFYKDHILTGGFSGQAAQWDLEIGNEIASFNTKCMVNSAIGFKTGEDVTYDSVVIQGDDSVSLVDTVTSEYIVKARVLRQNFAKCSLLQAGASRLPLVLCPSNCNVIELYDFRSSSTIRKANNEIKGNYDSTAAPSHIIRAPNITHDRKKDIGALQCCSPLKALGDCYVISTFESGLLAVYDIRNLSEPVFPNYILDTDQAIPSLVVRDNFILIGDTGGTLWLLKVDHSNGFKYVKSVSVFDESSKAFGIGSLAMRHDSKVIAAACWDRCIRLIDFDTLKVKCTLRRHTNNVTDICFDDSSGHFASAGKDGNVYVWSTNVTLPRQTRQL